MLCVLWRVIEGVLASRADGRGDSKTEAPSWTSYLNTSDACVCTGWPHRVQLEWVVKRMQPTHPASHRQVPSSLLTSRSSLWRPGETSPADTSLPRPCQLKRDITGWITARQRSPSFDVARLSVKVRCESWLMIKKTGHGGGRRGGKKTTTDVGSAQKAEQKPHNLTQATGELQKC